MWMLECEKEIPHINFESDFESYEMIFDNCEDALEVAKAVCRYKDAYEEVGCPTEMYLWKVEGAMVCGVPCNTHHVDDTYYAAWHELDKKIRF
ncbi:MAG TPA: hypothetical protein DCW90_09715 [Lachnospiraceae bacterium]|nr:hypothetical protein [Lachnospiraceae bacterium]